jgi:hypothetical protein
VISRRQVQESCQETAERLVIEGDVVVITNRAASRVSSPRPRPREPHISDRSKSGLDLASIIPRTRNLQHCGAAIVTVAAGDYIVPAHCAISTLAQGSEKSEDAIAGLNFEGQRRTENQTAGGKCSWLDGSSADAGRVESGSSGNWIATIRACDIALSDFAHHIERLLRGIGEGSTQVVTNIPDVDTGKRSLVARVTSAVDLVCPVEGVA